jgi:hypothetical protein
VHGLRAGTTVGQIEIYLVEFCAVELKSQA